MLWVLEHTFVTHTHTHARTRKAFEGKLKVAHTLKERRAFKALRLQNSHLPVPFTAWVSYTRQAVATGLSHTARIKPRVPGEVNGHCVASGGVKQPARGGAQERERQRERDRQREIDRDRERQRETE